MKNFIQLTFLAIWSFLKAIILSAAVIAAPVVAVAVAVIVMVFTSLPGPTPEARPVPVSKPAVILDAEGNQIAVLRNYDEAQPTTPEDINANIVNALVAAEDRRFFDHTGVDPLGIARAARTNIEQGTTLEGGSTITQQLIKNRYLGGEQTFARKIREAVLAQRLEREMTKEEILFEYLSSVYFGSSAYGLRSASEVYFRTNPKDLSISQAATLIGLLPSPSSNSPHENIELAERGRTLVLNAMLETELISQEEHAEALTQTLVAVDGNGNPPGGFVGPHTAVWERPSSDLGVYPKFTRYVENYLVEKYGSEVLFQRGIVVETTLEPRVQQEVQVSVNAAVQGAGDPGATAAAAVVEPKNGFILAMADSQPWEITQVNYAAGGSTGFQPGSSFKPFVVAAAMEAGSRPDRVINYGGGFTTADGIVLGNYGGEGGGSATISDATRVSLNTPFLILADEVGAASVAEVAERVGVKSMNKFENFGVSVALGAYEVSPLEMASAYATFANGGLYMPPVPVARVITEDGQIIEDNTIRSGIQAIDSSVADNLTGILTRVVETGTGVSAQTAGRQIAGKTGTAENYTAAWFAGYTPNFSAAVWLGHNDGVRPLTIYGNREIVGGGPPAVTWSRIYGALLDRFPAERFASPGPLVPPAQQVNSRREIESIPLAAGQEEGVTEEEIMTRRNVRGAGAPGEKYGSDY